MKDKKDYVRNADVTGEKKVDVEDGEGVDM
jgi:hypothetical protein